MNGNLSILLQTGKMRLVSFFLGASCWLMMLTGTARGGVAFQNLNFEAANIPRGTQLGASVPPADALPGWTPSTTVLYNGVSLGGPIISIVDTNGTQYGISPLQGKYSVGLFAGGSTPLYSVSISQTAQVPGNANSLLVDAFAYLPFFVVSLGGKTINMVPVENFPTYTEYGGDISSFAGQVAQLSLTELPPEPPNPPPSFMELENIVFSTSPIPEPGALALIGTGAVLLGLWRGRSFQIGPR